ncbi:hypothetical protein DEFDS_0417 [Deferribacter desulfuricans SSM1]|uniref:Uncharacterized protein n=1 Tax=Deferribacter desulfuricans (strain DSM 14783 / JCM 11476 / NBRC 101012 / SSM1) TaxID=639282 RepID=D3PBD8_DEFDS|nr:hypothetical protein [Deferribacter desulfuricans]BAI79911.1 hypothetical protein DEFDS_0417 [Deferribacter desulfuricans SSM1]
MKGIYGYVALLIASLSFMISFGYKVFHLDYIDIENFFSLFLRDLMVFFVVYFIAKYFFKNIEMIFNNYRKIL